MHAYDFIVTRLTLPRVSFSLTCPGKVVRRLAIQERVSTTILSTSSGLPPSTKTSLRSYRTLTLVTQRRSHLFTPCMSHASVIDLILTFSSGGSHSGTSWKQTGYCGLGRSVESLGLQINKPLNLDFVVRTNITILTPSIELIALDLLAWLPNTRVHEVHIPRRSRLAPPHAPIPVPAHKVFFAGDNGLTELTLRTAKAFPTKSLSDPRRLIQASTADEWKDRVRVYFPSYDTVVRSRGGPNAGGTISFQSKWFDNGKFPKDVLRDCVSVREGLVMHNKVSSYATSVVL